MGFYRGPNIVTDGLVFAIDAGSTRSYPGSGTTATSLVGSHVSTLKNGVGFSSGNAGAFTFDGVDQYIEIPYSTELDPTAGITFDAWVYPTNITTNQFYEIYRKENASARHLFAFQNNGTILAFGTHTTSNSYTELDVSITASDFVNKWSHIVASYQSGSKVIYVNGQSVGSTTGITGTLVQGTAAQILGSNGGGNEFFQGNYPSFKMYNRGISAAEVLQNYNAQKSRYGL